MKKTLSMLLSGALTLVLALPVVAQAEEVRTELLGDIGRTMTQVQAELAAIDEREASDDWMVFESQDRGLIEVDLTRIDEWIPAAKVLRDGSSSEQAMSDAVASRVPDLWEASVLLADAPEWVFDAGSDAVIAWLRDRFGHLQTPERKAALYDAERARLLEDLEALRRTQEFFESEVLLTETPQTETAQTESAQVESFCREIAKGETLMAEDGSTTYLGEPIPPIEDLPDWCRDALLVWLTGSDEPLPTPPVEDGVAAQIRQSQDPLEWETDKAIDHGRWNGLWEYWGYPGLTLVQVGDHVFGTYQDGDGWMKLAVQDEHTLIGHWYENEHASITCESERDGTQHWGSLQLHFDDDFSAYEGTFGDCGDLTGSWIDGNRAQ